jgi:hypothetical protein
MVSLAHLPNEEGSEMHSSYKQTASQAYLQNETVPLKRSGPRAEAENKG